MPETAQRHTEDFRSLAIDLVRSRASVARAALGVAQRLGRSVPMFDLPKAKFILTEDAANGFILVRQKKYWYPSLSCCLCVGACQQ